MAYLEWDKSFNVNVKEIDEQHKKLVSMINTLHSAFIDSRGENIHKEIIDNMVEYATIHFATEEKYMEKFNFPASQTHKKEHDNFTREALNLQTQLRIGGFVLSIKILNYLKSWLQNHILVTDKNYSKFFNKHGLY